MRAETVRRWRTYVYANANPTIHDSDRASSSVYRARPFDSIIKEYRGVFIGTARDEVRQKLGKRQNEYPGEDNFELSDTESVRVFFDDANKVKAIVITYTGNLDTAPKPNDVIGEPLRAGADGAMYKMVRVEKRGFWLSYVKTAGDRPTVMITVQSIDTAKSE